MSETRRHFIGPADSVQEVLATNPRLPKKNLDAHAQLACSYVRTSEVHHAHRRRPSTLARIAARYRRGRKPVTLTPNATFQSAIVASREELSQERVALESATARVAREHGETDAERAKVAESIAALVRRYAFVRGKIQDALLNVDPDAAVSPTELERRKRLIDRTFRMSQSDLGRQPRRDSPG